MPDAKRPPPQEPIKAEIRHIGCPACESPKAVIAATHYRELLCFCPACHHTWDCEDALT